MVVARNGFHQDVRQLGVYVCPDVDHLVVTLVVGDETHVIVVDYLLHLFVTSDALTDIGISVPNTLIDVEYVSYTIREISLA